MCASSVVQAKTQIDVVLMKMDENGQFGHCQKECACSCFIFAHFDWYYFLQEREREMYYNKFLRCSVFANWQSQTFPHGNNNFGFLATAFYRKKIVSLNVRGLRAKTMHLESLS